MIKNYLQQLKQLQEDKLNFQNQTSKNQLTKTLSRQEDKYHAYIIEQMACQNRIIAASNIADTLGKLLRRKSTILFQKIKKNKFLDQSSTSIRRRACDESAHFDGDSVPVDLMLMKFCASLICRYAEKAHQNVQKETFSTILHFSKKKQALEKVCNITKKYYQRKGVHALRTVEKRPIQSEDGLLFNDSFSVIHRQDKIKSKHFEESCLSFILDKQNNNADCLNCRDSCQLVIQKDKQINKLKEQASYLKHLLAQKALELKKKQEEIDEGVGKSYLSDQQSSISHNSSYYSQLQRKVFGGKRIRKNGSRLESTSQLPKQEISKQLLGKYMRESFQYKQSMDVARELCLDLQHSLPLVYNKHLQHILKVLNMGEEVSLVDQYA